MCVVMLAWGAPLWAVPTAGPRDGEAGPPLPAVATPAVFRAEKLADTTFPQTLEKQADYPSALLEWQRIAHQYGGAERENALLNVARLQTRLGHPAAPATLWGFLQEYPASGRRAQALYLLTRATRGQAYAQAFTQLLEVEPQGPWSRRARFQAVWRQAQAGAVTQTYGLPEAQALAAQLLQLRAQRAARTTATGTAGVLPGAGHAVAGYPVQGAVLLVAWALFMLAFLSSCRHRHYAYSFLFIVPAVALWLTSPAVAIQLARQQSWQQVQAVLEAWRAAHAGPLQDGAATP